jgi:hypothetical protein
MDGGSQFTSRALAAKRREARRYHPRSESPMLSLAPRPQVMSEARAVLAEEQAQHEAQVALAEERLKVRAELLCVRVSE